MHRVQILLIARHRMTLRHRYRATFITRGYPKNSIALHADWTRSGVGGGSDRPRHMYIIATRSTFFSTPRFMTLFTLCNNDKKKSCFAQFRLELWSRWVTRLSSSWLVNVAGQWGSVSFGFFFWLIGWKRKLEVDRSIGYTVSFAMFIYVEKVRTWSVSSVSYLNNLSWRKESVR